MAVFEPLDKTFFYYPNARTIAMVTDGIERLRLDLEGHLRLGTITDQSKTKEADDVASWKDRLKVIGEPDTLFKGKPKYAFHVTNYKNETLFFVGNDGQISFNLSKLEGFEIFSAELLQYDWLFLRQSRNRSDPTIRSGFHIRDPWRTGDVDTPLNRLEIAYRMPNGQERPPQFVIHGPTGNVGINTENPAGDKLRIKGTTNDNSAFALSVTNANSARVFGVRNNGEILLGAIPFPSGGGTIFDLVMQNNQLVRFPSFSSQRFKNNIRPLNENFSAILNAEPKAFTWKESGGPGIGYIAEEFHALGLQRLVTYDENGEPFSVDYKMIPVYLLEVVKTHEAAVTMLNQENAALKAELSQTQTELRELKTKMEKMESALQELLAQRILDKNQAPKL